MKELKNILLTIITENQKFKVRAERFAELLLNDLGEEWEILNIEKYQKFDNSYKIDFKGSFIEKGQDELNQLSIRLTDKFVSPWLVYYDKTDNSIELIFNKDANTRNKKVEFNVIKWGNLKFAK